MQIKNEKVKCPICALKCFPSNDHVPPKSCGNSGTKYQYFFINGHDGKAIKKRVQNGIYFKYLCPDCNSKLLGAKYDPELANFYKFVINSKDNKIIWQGNITKIVKSIFGHILATYEFTNCIFDKAMRKYILRDIFPEHFSLNLFYYPNKSIFIAKNSMPLQHYKRQNSIIPKNFLCCSLYFYPFAFIFSYKKRLSCGVDLLRLIENKSNAIILNKNSWINNTTYNLLPDIWPFYISDERTSDTVDAIFGGAEMNSLSKILDVEDSNE